jgi:hypothetical protein
MKENRDTSTHPPLLRVSAHAYDIPRDHASEIKRPENKQALPQNVIPVDKVTTATSKIETYLPIEPDDQNLADEQLGIGE